MPINPAERIHVFLRALDRMKRIADEVVATNDITVVALRRAYDSMGQDQAIARTTWDNLRSEVGGATARRALRRQLEPVPADETAKIGEIWSAWNSARTAYNQFVPAQGVRAWTYDRTNQTHVELTVDPADKAPIDTELTALSVILADFVAD